MKNPLDPIFHLTERGTSVRTELLAGLTTFATMSYIVLVNPLILSVVGMPSASLLVATCLGSALATFLMALLSNRPLALAPGMGLNAFFVSMVLSSHATWQEALAAVFVGGLLFMALSASSLRKKIIDDIPESVKRAIPAGIGLFIGWIGIQTGGLIPRDLDAFLSPDSLLAYMPIVLTLTGIAVIGMLEAMRIQGAILWGIILITAMAIPLNLVTVPAEIFSLPPSIAPIFMKMDFSAMSLNLFNPKVFDFWALVFMFFFVDFFDTIGTLVGVAKPAGMVDEKGNLKNARGVLLADSIGTVTGATLGLSPITTFVESAAGIAGGGRTGLTAIVIGILFLLAMFISPLLQMVPPFATAPALIFVAIYMMRGVTGIPFRDWTELIPALFIMFAMPISGSITTGIEMGMVSYVICKLLSRRTRDISTVVWILAFIFIIREALRYFVLT